MSVHVIEYKNGGKTMRPIQNFKEFAALRNSKQNREMTQQARNGNAEGKRKMIQFNYSCMPNDGKLKGATVESNSVGMDVDFQAGMDKEEFQRQFDIVKENILAKADELGLLMLERSATKGLHVVFRRHPEMSQEENLKWASKMLGVEADPAAKDITRVFFTPTADAQDLFFCKDELFINEAAEGKKEERTTGTATKSPSTVAGLTAEASKATEEQSDKAAEAQSAPQGDVIYFGYNFTKIIAKYWEVYNGGKEPVVGNRNALIFDLARSLRAICDYDINVLKLVIPRYCDLPQEEYEQCLKNAIDEPRKGINFKLQKVLNLLNEEENKGKSQLELVNALDSKLPPQMPTILPSPLGELCSRAPEYYRPAVCENLFPPMAVNMSGVKFMYWDNVLHEATFMELLAAQMSIGKGCVTKPCEMMVSKISENDKVAREREAQWKLKNPQGATSLEARPKDLCVQSLIDNLTDAVFNQRVADAAYNGEKYIYVKVDELDTLKNITSRNSEQEVSTIIRKAFDNSPHGQERVGSASVTGIAPLRFNFNASSCPKNARNFFRKNITDGTITRLSVSTIIKPEGARPVYGIYDDEYRATVNKVVDLLESFHGTYKCEEANKFAQNLCDENERLAELYDSEGYLVLSYRATVIAWLKGMVLWLLNGQQWTTVIEDYVRWSLRYDLWCKMLIFGEMLEKEIAENKLSNHRGPQNLCEMLPEIFRLKDLENLRSRLGKRGGSAKNLLAKWKARGIVSYESIDGEIVKCKV